MRLNVWLVSLTLCATSYSFIEVVDAAPPAKGKPTARAVADDPDVYVRAVEGKIKQHWSIAKGNAKQSATILVTIGRAGDLKEAKIQRSSGSKDFDESVQAAARKAVPYPALPKSFPDAVSIEISLTYDIKYQAAPATEPAAKKPLENASDTAATKPEPIAPTTTVTPGPEPIEPTTASPLPDTVSPAPDTTVSPAPDTTPAPDPTVSPDSTTVPPTEPGSPTKDAPATPSGSDQAPATPSGEPGASSGSEGSGTGGGADPFDPTSGSGNN